MQTMAGLQCVRGEAFTASCDIEPMHGRMYNRVDLVANERSGACDALMWGDECDTYIRCLYAA